MKINIDKLLSILFSIIVPTRASDVTPQFGLTKNSIEVGISSNLNWKFANNMTQKTTFILQVNKYTKDNTINKDEITKSLNKLPKKTKRLHSTKDLVKSNNRKSNSNKNNKLFIKDREYKYNYDMKDYKVQNARTNLFDEARKVIEINGTEYNVQFPLNKYVFDKSYNHLYSTREEISNGYNTKNKNAKRFTYNEKIWNSPNKKQFVNSLHKIQTKRCTDEEQTYDYFVKPWKEIDYLYIDDNIMSTNCMTNGTKLRPQYDRGKDNQQAISKQFLRNEELGGDLTLQYVYDETLVRSPTGGHNRMETYNGEPAVYMPSVVFMLRGHLKLLISEDWLQVAADAFAIIFYGSVQDVLRLPAAYVLASARTISLMLISREKLEAMWTVVKAGRHPRLVPCRTLELFRPLFGYIPTHDLQQLNFIQDRHVMKYIGTHPDLTRHKAGVVAMRIHAEFPQWVTAENINIMMGLICGFPVSILRTLSISVFLQLDATIFYHIHACEALQRQFLLAAMCSTEVLGKSQSWHASDVMRLGFLIVDISAEDLRVIDPKAMIGLSTKVILKMPHTTLLYITELQFEALASKQRMLLSRMLKNYRRLQDSTIAHDAIHGYKNPQLSMYNSRHGGVFKMV